MTSSLTVLLSAAGGLVLLLGSAALGVSWFGRALLVVPGFRP